MARVIGIDLGTTNSVMAVIEGGDPVIIPNAEGDRVTPSVVALDKHGERLVGQVARRQAVTNPEHTISSVKRFMGRKITDPTVQRDRELVPYRLSAAPNNDVRVLLQGREYAPPEISAMVLGKLKADAEAFLGAAVTQAVITVPAYFDDSQRQATRDAGKIAGLEILRIINEPTASALAYGLERQDDDQLIAVYDLGGGTFDISILELSNGVVEVKATAGDTHLGGDDVDQLIVNWLIDDFATETGIDLRKDRVALQRLKEAAEKAKMELSSVLRSDINLPFITADKDGPRHLSVTLTRAMLEATTHDLIARSLDPVRRALADANLTPDRITHVVLVGGQTRMPAVQQAVAQFFGKEPIRSVNPDEVVALGAAIQAGVLTKEIKDVILLDVTPLTLGIKTLGAMMTPLIERNTTIPTHRTQVFSTVADNQTSVSIQVYQGERAEVQHNKLLGSFELTNLPPAPRGATRINVSFDIDANGITSVSAKDAATGREQRIVITPSSGLTAEEIERMLADAETYRENDRQQRELISVQHTADRLIYRAERVLHQQHGTSVARQRVEDRMRDLRTVTDSNDVAAIRAATAELSLALHDVVQPDSNGQPPQGSAAPPPEDDVSVV